MTDLFRKGSSILQQLIVCATALDYLPEPNNKTAHTGKSAAQIKKKRHVAPSITLYTGFVNSTSIRLYHLKSIP
jgi:hypothetical protein